MEKKHKIIVAPEKKEGESVTPQEQCQIDHTGQCGDCDNAGIFTPCPCE